MFKGRKLLIATKHHKESVIAPIFNTELGVHCFTSDAFDTDSLGTFSGEISRKDNALTTLRNKCILANEATGYDLIIATEGSFGPHPSLFFAAANDELIMLKDFQNDIEIIAREISMDTNFDGKLISSELELKAFAEKIQFPAHGIILKSTEDNPIQIIKNNRSVEELIENFKALSKAFKTVFAETDMRAVFNPTRMKFIQKAAENLLIKIKNCCPNCETPGFDIVAIKPGLKCENCSFPTRSTLSHIYHCKKCNFKYEKMFPRGIQFEDPTYCDFCNP